ncbi:MAG: Crp/Fnr family transcriptional regulator [Acidimicrobiales bacterium]|nr:Crp/Fnr family transcriptional regulator [Acidimicrobiales bacterium]
MDGDGAPDRGFAEALDARALADLRAAGVRRTWPAGAVLFREGDRADRVLVLESGTVKVVTTSSGGVEHILALRTAGAVLGELAVADGGPRSATAVATTPVEALAVPAARFRTFLTDHPAATLELLTIAIGRLRAADRQRAEFGSTDTITRLVRTLRDLARSHGRTVDGGIRLDLLSQDDLAALCGSSREAVSRSLGTLRAAGLVATGRRSVTILDIDGIDAWEV